MTKSRVVRISKFDYDRIKKLATPLTGSPSEVVEKILDFYEKNKSLYANQVDRSNINQ